MERHSFFIILAFFLLDCKMQDAPMSTQSSNVLSNPGYISVRDFGAKGDGKSDDTRAIKAAVNQANGSLSVIKRVAGRELSIYVSSTPTVFFPSGTYVISEPINIERHIRLLGDKAILIPSSDFTKSEKYAFSGKMVWTKLEGLQFVGFNNAVEVKTDNLDTGNTQIEDCDFIHNGVAISLDAQSSLSLIKENRFVRNQKALIIKRGDKVIFSENWVTAGILEGNRDAHIINNGGILHFDNNLLVPSPPKEGAVEPAWINNYRTIMASGIRQGGEPGSYTLVNNFAKADVEYPYLENAVTIKNSDCYAVYGNTKTYKNPAAIRLMEIPNMVVLEDLRGFKDAQVIDFPRSTPSSYSSNAKANLPPTQHVKIRIANVMGYMLNNDRKTILPSILEEYQIKE